MKPLATPCQAPISWLRLERHHLGELTKDREAVVEHLGSCAECAAALAQIAEDARDLPALPALPVAAVPAPPKLAPVRPPAPPWYVTRRSPLAIASGLALAALLVLAIGRRPQPRDDDDPAGARMKGSDLSFTLVREDEAVIAEAGGSYRDGERFKAVLTCPPGMRASFDVAVYEHGVASFPLPPSTGVACGNAVALPGAFRMVGHERMTVCLVWQPDGTIDREALRRTPPEMLDHAHCKTLDPSP